MSVSILNTRASELPAPPIAATFPSGNPTDFQRILDTLLPSPIVHRGGPIDEWQRPLPDAESAFVRNSVQRRVREFTAGRNCARDALETLGHENVVIPMGARRQPLWPAGIVGSISHGAGYCLAAVCTRSQFASLGVDIEAATPLSTTLTRLVCTPSELNWCERQGEALVGLLAKFHFSAKESVFKCLYPVFGEELEFHDVQLDLCLHEERFVAQVRGITDAEDEVTVRGRLACTADLVMTSAVLQDDDYRFLPIGYGFNAMSGIDMSGLNGR